MFKKLRFLLLFFIMSSFVSCTSHSKDDGINIVASLNPNYNLVKYIAQDKVNIYYLSQGNAHDMEFKTEDIKKVNDADAVFYNGLGIDDKVLDLSEDKSKFVQTTQNANLIELNYKESGHEIDDHHHHDGDYDPHVWLSINEYKTMGKVVLDKLVQIDPSNKDFYNKNYEDFIKRADSIYNSYINDFKTLVNKEFISNHASYGYLARDFGLINDSLYDVNNHGEVNPKNIQGIIDIVKSKNIRLIIGDKYESNKELETISNETGVTYKVVNNLEKQGDYFTQYQELLSSIYDGLR